MSGDKAYNKTDYSSQSNLSEAKSTHIHLNWSIDFERSTISGSAKHSVSVLQNTTKFVVDTNRLLVTSATVQGQAAKFAVAQPHPTFGSALSVDLGAAGVAGAVVEVEIFYETHPEANATQWLAPSLTAGKVHPYLFSQCQAIHARSLLPCQDAPGNKITYSAQVTAPQWATVLMSAVFQRETYVGQSREFRYDQPVPIPTYLIAIAVGELESRDVSPRVKVWAEPSMVEAVQYEFAQTEEFLQIAEGLTSPYMWGRYDVLCLPPSFPYGGMENPCLTFVTPTLLAGDRSLADVVAHEISHSWTGNLITNHTWEHFWLNEGWTVWLERKIMAGIHKDDRYRHFVATIGWKHLKDDIALFGEDNPLTQLIPPLEGVDPDDSFSSVPYEKGFAFLFYLENLVSSAKFDVFAHAYIDKFKYSTITSGEFRDFFVEFFRSDAEASAVIAREVDWDRWFNTPGMPPYTPTFDQTFANASISLADKWLSILDGREALPRGVGPDDIKGWSTQQTIILLERMYDQSEVRKTTFPETALASMDQLYHFTENRNSEISLRWQQLCLRSECAWIVPHVVRFVTTQGRMKFVRPLYRALFKSTVGRSAAVEVFSEHHAFYHPIARKMVAVDLNVNVEKIAAQAKSRTVGAVNIPVTPSKTITINTTANESSSNATTWIFATAAVAAVAAAAFYYTRRR